MRYLSVREGSGEVFERQGRYLGSGEVFERQGRYLGSGEVF